MSRSEWAEVSERSVNETWQHVGSIDTQWNVAVATAAAAAAAAAAGAIISVGGTRSH